jgi:hypothetical protein
MKKEYDFSKGVRGKFYNPDGEFNLPIYLEPEIAEFVKKLADKKNLDQSRIVNLLLKNTRAFDDLLGAAFKLTYVLTPTSWCQNADLLKRRLLWVIVLELYMVGLRVLAVLR